MLVEVIRHHHDPELAGADAALAATIHLAEILTQDLAKSEGSTDLRYSINAAALDLTGLQFGHLTELSEELQAEMLRAKDFVNG